MALSYFSSLMRDVSNQSATSALGLLGFKNESLNRYLYEKFKAPYGGGFNFLGNPAFEAVFGWTYSDMTMAQLSGSLLHPALIKALDEPEANFIKYRFAKLNKPYTHQIEAWETLIRERNKSLIVSSGTGSGKTECFMIPILDHLVREQADSDDSLSGVRALFLYPLNALINSQRERLAAWTSRFGTNIRFCLYNGITPETVKSIPSQRSKSEVLDRLTLRRNPPPILVTNATMLEYMLVRSKDAPIIEASKGKLKYIVLDEAHTYIGSQAAEVSLLLRRVLNTFNVDPKEVRFIATSATMGNTNDLRLKEFLADIAGLKVEEVKLITGQRNIPDLKPLASVVSNDLNYEELVSVDNNNEESISRYNLLCGNTTAGTIRKLFTGNSEKTVVTVNEVIEVLQPGSKVTTEIQNTVLNWFDLLSGTLSDQGVSYLPLRGHLFHQTVMGLWACCDSNCKYKMDSSLAHEDWPFGAVYNMPRIHCLCGAPVFELVSCDDCGTPLLKASESMGKLKQSSDHFLDKEFEIEIEEDFEEKLDSSTQSTESTILIVNRMYHNTGAMSINKYTSDILQPGDDCVDLIVYDQGDCDAVCPHCLGKASPKNDKLRRAMIGVSFTQAQMLPVLLEFGSDADNPNNKPYRGRRVLSFTDSRQGTARLAAIIQQTAERQKIRGFIYHLVIQHHLVNAEDANSKLKGEIDGLELMISNMPNNKIPIQIRELLNEKRRKLEFVPAISFEALRLSITQQAPDFRRILDQYQFFSPELFGGSSGSNALAGLMILRELGRRPKRQNNLETMGMVSVTYPALQSVKQIPGSLREYGFTLDDWKRFLKLVLDISVRGAGALEYPDPWRFWLGLPASRSWLVDANSGPLLKNQKRWPTVKGSRGQSTLVRILAQSLREDINTPLGADRVDYILLEAWEVIRPMLTLQSNGYSLQLDKLSFSVIEDAWICPVTHKFLDTTFNEITPYVPSTDLSLSSEEYRCERIHLPVYPYPFGNSTDENERLQKARQWLRHNDTLSELRLRGLWSDLNDKVIEFIPYIKTAEHSAQQPSSLLQRYEDEFRDGDINLLSCSTTMEMGIDIGGVQVVAMNNVPPHPANYLQRAGRAGRRNESRSFAITLCRSNPHDLNVFGNAKWAFETPLPPPIVSLDSKIIVQRHINAYLLSKFLLSLSDEDIPYLNCGWFFLEKDNSISNDFLEWCYEQSCTSENTLVAGLISIVRKSVLAVLPVENIIKSTASQMLEISMAWFREWDAIIEQEAEINTSGAELVAKNAIAYQKSRIKDEYLLRELTTRGYLPSHGFPSDIVSFNNITIADMRRLPSQNGLGISRVDNAFVRRELPSRDAVTALREYAPGANIIINGLTYVSAGISLNWHIPANQDDVREVQSLRFAWRCRKCGANGTSQVRNNVLKCSECNVEIMKGDIVNYLDPAGFSVDFYSEPLNSYETKQYIPYEAAWISTPGVWELIGTGHTGRCRISSNGRIFHFSSGPMGFGYALCLKCGRVHPMTTEGKLPVQFSKERDHRKLRGKKHESICEGSSNTWAIKSGLLLGHEIYTDIVEIQLKNTLGIWLNDLKTAYTLAVALRNSLAAILGIQTSELGNDIRESVGPDGAICQSIFIFDHHTAGYSTNIQKYFKEVFNQAKIILTCPSNCETSCPCCLMDYDQRFASDKIDRKLGLEYLNEILMYQFDL